MKKLLLIFAFICVNLTAYSQHIIVSPKKGYDVINVYVTTSSYEADAIVYSGRSRYNSSYAEGYWYIERPRYHSGKYYSYNYYGNGITKICYVDRRWESDIIVKFTKYRSGIRIKNSKYFKYFNR